MYLSATNDVTSDKERLPSTNHNLGFPIFYSRQSLAFEPLKPDWLQDMRSLPTMTSASDSSARIVVIDVPTEAGTHWPGQVKAPEALRKAGLTQKLERAGYQVSSLSALDQPQHWVPTDIINGVRDEENALKVMKRVSDVLIHMEGFKGFPIILGGDCSIESGVLSGINALYHGERIGLIYFDGDADLTLPTTAGAGGLTGILDSMVLTHLTQRPGGLQSMRQFAKADGAPLVDKDNIVLFGMAPDELLPEHWTFLLEGGFKAFTSPTISKDPPGKAKEAIEWLESRVDRVLIHFDLDVIDTARFPLGNFPHYAGLQYEEALSAFRVLVGCSKFCGLVITEVNPNNDPSGEMVQRLVDDIVECLSQRI